MSKRVIYLLGFATLLLFPITGFLFQHFVRDMSWSTFLALDEVWKPETIFGMVVGVIYAFFAMLFLGAPVFESLPNRVENMVRRMNLSFWDVLFLSICAGVGEELLFRTSIQPELGIVFTSVFFVAIHGYLNPMNWRMSLYGLIILPFVFILGAGFNTFGQWFSIGAHFSYDLVLFIAIRADYKN